MNILDSDDRQGTSSLSAKVFARLQNDILEGNITGDSLKELDYLTSWA